MISNLFAASIAVLLLSCGALWAVRWLRVRGPASGQPDAAGRALPAHMLASVVMAWMVFPTDFGIPPAVWTSLVVLAVLWLVLTGPDRRRGRSRPWRTRDCLHDTRLVVENAAMIFMLHAGHGPHDGHHSMGEAPWLGQAVAWVLAGYYLGVAAVEAVKALRLSRPAGHPLAARTAGVLHAPVAGQAAVLVMSLTMAAMLVTSHHR